jgi:hypothetical protein
MVWSFLILKYFDLCIKKAAYWAAKGEIVLWYLSFGKNFTIGMNR